VKHQESIEYFSDSGGCTDKVSDSGVAAGRADHAVEAEPFGSAADD
jgi:hypothetical protein